MTSYATRTQSSSEQNDLKKLKSKYSSKLTTLRELFADWSDEDLLFALDEADGVLEIAVDRISEGHATQWGEVKTKKSKKEAQQKAKAAAAASVPSPAQPMTYQKPLQATKSYTERPKSAKAPRVPTTNNYSRKPTATSTKPSWGYNSGQKSTDTTGGGSWASIASTKPANEPSSSDWNTSSLNDSWDQPSSSHEDKDEITTTAATTTTTTTSSALLDDTDKPKSWASLLKTQPKPEPVEKQQESSEWTTGETQTNEPTTDGWNTKDDEPIKDEWSAPVEVPSSAWGATEPEDAAASEPVEEDEAKKSLRRLKQDSPVVMPNNDISVSSADVKFGSLNLDDETAPQEKSASVEESLTDTKVETQPLIQSTTEPTVEQSQLPQQQQASQSQQHTTPAPSAPSATATTTNQQQPSYLKQEPVYNQPQSSQMQPQQSNQQQQPQQISQQQQQPPQPVQQQPPQQIPQQPPQQQQQQQPFGMDHLTSAYSSYLPNQHPTGMSGFGMSPMGNLPDYGVYGTEAQRAAAMGYYDPSAFNNSPAATNASTYPARDKFGQDTSASIGTPQAQSAPGQNQGLHGQQMYPGMPYYPYYYMPNHYSAYQQSMYGQPMMNKNMYPNMYQQQATSSSKPSTQSSYGGNGAAASPYALHSQLYNQPSNAGGVSGYDDLQQQFGLHDYQKSPYSNTGGQQLQGFLGHHLQGQQQSQQGSQQPSQPGQGQAVDPSKSDASRGSASSQPQQQQHQMNYFGQQQMFSYQQYPQQQYWNQ